MKEIWKDVNGYEGLYKINNFGYIKSLKDCNYISREKILKFSKNDRGYLSVRLYKNTKWKIFRVNRLVAINFLPNPKNKPQVNHKDGNKQNNNVNNLEWCTHSENQNHAYSIGLKEGQKGEKSKNSKLTEQSVKIIKKSTTISQIELAKIFNVRQATISLILTNKTWNHV